MQWTDSKIEQLKEQGSIATEIAKVFGTSRCSILGKANRLKLTPRKRGCSSGTRSDVPKYKPKKIPRYKPKEIPSSAIAEPENPTLLEDLLNNQCRFPLWDKPDEPSLCCGRNRHKHYSYCAYHVYVATKKVEGSKTLDLNNKP